MGRSKRKNKRAGASAGREDDEVEEEERGDIKRQCGALQGRRLTEEQEDRLGRWSTSVQWIIKIAQGRGSNACLAFVSIAATRADQSTLRGTMQSEDGQQVSVVLRGAWVEHAVGVLHAAGASDYIVLLSGLGASIAPSGSEVVFASGKLVAEVCKAQSNQSIGWLEVADDNVISTPSFPNKEQEPTMLSSALENPSRRNSCAVEEKNRARTQVLEPPPPPSISLDSCFQTPVRAANPIRESASSTPGWLATPAATNHRQRKDTSEAGSPIPPKNDRRSTKDAKLLGTRIYTPVSLLPRNDFKQYNVIALVTTDLSSRQALGGTRDWKVTIGLTDVEQTKDTLAAQVPFNLFARTAEGLPRCKPSSILLLQGVMLREFNGAPQGTGRSGDFEWAAMDTTSVDEATAFTSSQCCLLADAERKEMRRLCDLVRRSQRGLGPAVPARRANRPLITLSAVEADVFFDATVEILKVWDRSRPPEIYVTDYTSHPLFYGANDVHLGALSREELQDQQEESNDEGNGRVLSISLWDDQEEAVQLVRVGMVVRLENVRAKLQPNRFLCGTMGGGVQSSQGERLKIVVVNDGDVISGLEKRKAEYLDVVAVKKRGVAGIGGTASPSRLARSESHSKSPSSSPSTPALPPPGQQPLLPAAVSRPRTLSSSRSGEGEPEQAQDCPTLIEDKISAYPVTFLQEIDRLSPAQLTKGKLFLCHGRVCDMKPRCVDEIVEAVCGLCKSKLPMEHAFCASCAEEDGKQLEFRFNFALMVEQTDQELAALGHSLDGEHERAKHIIRVRDQDAKHFLHGFHPADVRRRPSTMARLKQRLLPLLGARRVFGDGAARSQEPLPFAFGVEAHAVKLPDGRHDTRYYLTHTRLAKDAVT